MLLPLTNFGAGQFGTVAVVTAAEVSLVVSSVAAGGSIAAVVLSYRLGVQRFEHERRLADLDAVRRVVDDAAAAMQAAHGKMAMIYKHLGNYADGAEGKVYPLIREHRFQVEMAYDELATQESRLEIRFGSDHELANICRSAGSKILALAYFTDEIESAVDPAAAVVEHEEKIDRAVLEVGLARESFTVTAYRAVGVRLPPKQLADV